MATTKVFEVRDRATYMVVLATKFDNSDERERVLLASAGYGRGPTEQGRYVVTCTIHGGAREAHDDAYSWDSRTMRAVHRYLEKHFHELDNGAVLDVEFIVGETPAPKQPQTYDFETY